MRNPKLTAILAIAALIAGLLAAYWVSGSKTSGSGEADVADGEVGAIDRVPERPVTEAPAVAPRSGVAPSAAVLDVGAAGSGSEERVAAADPTRPIISAIRAPHASLADKRTAMLTALEASGAAAPEDGAWASQAGFIFEAWQKQMPASALTGVVRGQPRCFHAGCAIDVEFQSEDAYNEAARVFRSISEPGAVHGGRVQTPAVATDNGRVIATWIMLQPSGAGHAQNPG